MDDEQRLSPDELVGVLVRAVDALEAAGIPYALMGGVASTVVGRHRHTRDLDIFVTPDAAAPALEALARAGFRTERTDEQWLYKAWEGDVLVDVIFVSKRGVVLDEEMREHCRTISVQGRSVTVLSGEDLLVIKALANAEHVPRHWYDGLGILATDGLDWPYLVRRALPHAGRVASLLLYALSEGIQVPGEPVRELFEAAMSQVPTAPETEADHHVVARVRQALATDPRVHELHVSVAVADSEVVVRGQVPTPARKEAIDAVLHDVVGDTPVRNEVEVA